MGKWLVLLGLTCIQVQAQTNWFTVTGNPREAGVNTVQVDPVAIGTSGDERTMNVRVNRSGQRRNWEEIPYRSYESQVVFNCRARKASYVLASFYMQPLWQGDPHQVSDYAAHPKPMLFLDMDPNPTARIIRAACRSTA